MAANVNSFLANFTGGGARANRYEVIIGFPNFLNIRDTAVQQKISFTCKAASIPASSIHLFATYSRLSVFCDKS